MRKISQKPFALSSFCTSLQSDLAPYLPEKTGEYQKDPVGYAKAVLGVCWWEGQCEIAEALLTHQYVFVKASHSIGKSHLAGGLVSWFHDVFPNSIVLTTAPTQVQVVDVMWKEVRRQCPPHLRARLQPKAPRMEVGPEYFAVGYTASTGDSFQGRHAEHVLVIFDEATGVDSAIWEAAEGMMTNPHGCRFLVICNPTDTSSRAYAECMQSGKWHVMSVSALDHPNIAAELAGLPAPYPSAVRLGWVRDRLKEWAEQIQPSEMKASDVLFDGKVYRPGALFESRVLGRWPSQGSTSVWSDAMWQACQVRQEIDVGKRLVFGCDKARFGDDYTSIFGRRGNIALHHETHNGWDNNQISGRLKQLCRAYAGGDDPKRVLCHVDDVQGGVIDLADGFNFVCINSSNKAIEEEAYPNKRSELWFATAERANEGRVDLSRLSPESKNLLRTQVMAPTWKVDAQGRRVVEPKSDTKKRVSRSPDDADALNLAFYGDGSDLTAALAVSRAGVQARKMPNLW